MHNLLSHFTKNIVLIGFMGTGKSSVGKQLARKLNRELLDIDAIIEAREKATIAEIFEKKGESYFRQLEKNVIAETAALESKVITTGGGVVLNPANMEILRKNGWIIALKATADTIYSRVKSVKTRPLLMNSSNMYLEIKRLLSERKALYENADYSFDTDQKTSTQVADQIVIAIEGNLTK